MNTQINDGGCVFPVPVTEATDGRTHDGGISIRDYFAAQALVGYIAAGYETHKPSELAKSCYEQADAMLKAREVKL